MIAKQTRHSDQNIVESKSRFFLEVSLQFAKCINTSSCGSDSGHLLKHFYNLVASLKPTYFSAIH